MRFDKNVFYQWILTDRNTHVYDSLDSWLPPPGQKSSCYHQHRYRQNICVNSIVCDYQTLAYISYTVHFSAHSVFSL